MIVEVFHGIERLHVATVDAPRETVIEALEFAYEQTQNIMGSWSRPGNPDHNECVTVIAPLPIIGGQIYGLRSSMVGDRFQIDDRTFEVHPVGWKELP